MNSIVSRYEHKFYIDKITFSSLQKMLSDLLQTDKNCIDNQSYLVTSLYYDSLNNSAYYDKIDGVEFRKKIRIRSYDNSDRLKFEIKEKHGDIIVKTSKVFSKKDFSDINTFLKLPNQNNQKKVSSIIDQNIYKKLAYTYRKPVVWVEYDRLAYTLPFNNVRITFDMNLRSKEVCGDVIGYDPPKMESVSDFSDIILEIKYNNYLPKHVARIFGAYSLNKSAISKYCNSRKVIY